MVAIERPHQPQRTQGFGNAGPEVTILSIETVDEQHEAAMKQARKWAAFFVFMALFGVAVFLLVNA